MFFSEIVKLISQSKIKIFRSSRFGIVILVFVLFVFAASVFGKTIKEYREHIGHLKNDFASIIGAGEKADKEAADFEREVLEKVSTFLPLKDEIEVGGKTIKINNEWIVKRITNYKNETKDQERKKRIAIEIYERLSAIELKVSELEADVTKRQSKDANKRKIAEILQREEYGKPTEEESFVQGLVRWIRELINSLFPDVDIKPNQSSGFQSIAYVFQIVLYILVLGAIGFLIYKFAPFILKRFRKNEKPEKKSERIILGEKLSSNENSETLFREAEKLASEGDLKAAVRKGYIALLFELGERKVFGLAKHKTNRDYLRDVLKRKTLYQSMSHLTLTYERYWYGVELVSESDWEEFRQVYKAATRINL